MPSDRRRVSIAFRHSRHFCRSYHARTHRRCWKVSIAFRHSRHFCHAPAWEQAYQKYVYGLHCLSAFTAFLPLGRGAASGGASDLVSIAFRHSRHFCPARAADETPDGPGVSPLPFGIHGISAEPDCTEGNEHDWQVSIAFRHSRHFCPYPWPRALPGATERSPLPFGIHGISAAA